MSFSITDYADRRRFCPKAKGVEHVNARRRMCDRPLFIGDWKDAVFINYEVDAGWLQSVVPFPLDLREGRAYVSLVAFTMSDFWHAKQGRWTRWLLWPFAVQRFLNVRTYVKVGDEDGIFFLTEFVSSPFSLPLGYLAYGLPYHLAKIEYRQSSEDEVFSGLVTSPFDSASLAYQAERVEAESYRQSEPGSLKEFLLERYVAFTSFGNSRRKFRIRHKAWLAVDLDLEVIDDSLMTRRFPFLEGANTVSAYHTPGVFDVWMGKPKRV